MRDKEIRVLLLELPGWLITRSLGHLIISTTGMEALQDRYLTIGILTIILPWTTARLPGKAVLIIRGTFITGMGAQ